MGDDWLKAVTAEARKEPQEDPRCDALAEGSLEEPSVLEPRERQAFRPLDDAAKTRITDAIVAQLEGEKKRTPGGAKAGSGGPPSAGSVVPLIAQSTRATAKESAPPSSSRRGMLYLVAAGAVAAAAAALVMANSSHHVFPPLPEYVASVNGGEKTERGEGTVTGTPRIGPGSRLEVTLRPATRVEGSVEVKAFLVRSTDVTDWSPPVEVADGGSVRVVGTRETLFAGVPAGEALMVFAVGRADALPSSADLRKELGKSNLRGTVAVKLLTYKVLIADAAGGMH